MIIDGDEFIEKPSETLRRVERFLGIPEFFSPSNFVFTGVLNIKDHELIKVKSLEGRKGFPCYQDLSSGVENQCMSRIKARFLKLTSEIFNHPWPGARPSPPHQREPGLAQDTLYANSGKLQKQNWNVDTIVMRLLYVVIVMTFIMHQNKNRIYKFKQ